MFLSRRHRGGAALAAALAFLAASPTAAAEKHIRYSAGGLLLSPLPQIEKGDSVVFHVSDAGAAPPAPARAYLLHYACGGEDGAALTRLPFDGTTGGATARLPADCVSGPLHLRWEIDTHDINDGALQGLLHDAVRSYSFVAGVARDRVRAEIAGVEPDVWARLKESMELANAIADSVRPGDEEGLPQAASFEQILHPVAFDETQRSTPPADLAAWIALHNHATAAFEPYRNLLADSALQTERASAELAEAESALVPLRRELDALAPSLTEAAGSQEREELLQRNRTIDAEIAELEGRIDAAQATLAWTGSYALDLVHPVTWLAAGETRTGWRHRVITIDPEEQRFNPAELPVDDQDTIWLALSNLTTQWRLTSIASQEAPGSADPYNAGLRARGGGDLGPAPPDIQLRSRTPKRRTTLERLGRRRGHHVVSFTASDRTGRKTFAGQFYVRRTWHVALKGALVLNYVPDRSLELVTDEAGNARYDAGVPLFTRPRPDYEPAPVLGIAFYLHPHDLKDDLRRPVWMRFLPHAFVGWAPTDIKRGYVGGGFEPFAGFSIVGGAALGASQVLAPPEGGGYEWRVEDQFSAGWFVGLATDLSLFYRIFAPAL